MNPFFLTDGYKLNHHRMYPNGTTLVYSNFTPRSNKHAPKGADGKPIDHVVSFGQQYFVRWIKELFDNEFFNKPKDEVISEIKTEFEFYLGTEYDTSHIEELHDLGYLPLRFKAIKEGTRVPMGVPVLTVQNTHQNFAWLTNYFETLLSNILWKPMTSAALALEYRRILEKYARETDKENLAIVDFQAHDFSMRGLSGVESTILSGMGHILSFSGSDNIPALPALRKYYDAEGFIGGGVPATEHSVMCVGTGFYIKRDGLNWEKYGEAEKEVFKELIREFPNGILSVVSDTWDLWKVLTDYLRDPYIKKMVMARDGKLVIRPDSGDPVDIVCGTGIRPWPNSVEDSKNPPHVKGVVELLWEEYGGIINEQGYKVLDSHIGCIYGDSITLQRAIDICERLKAKGFASTNVVLGVGSFTYQFNTRDTFGFAMKATYAEVLNEKNFKGTYENASIDVEGIEIFKDPITDDGTKKSARGLLKVLNTEDGLKLIDRVTWKEESYDSELQLIFEDGKFYNETSLTEIRERLKS